MYIEVRGVGIDWSWVKNQLLSRERISKPRKDKILAHVNETIKKAKFFVRPNVVTSIKKIALITPCFIKIEGGEVFSTKKISSYITGSSHIYIVLVTLGETLEKMSSLWMSEGKELEGYLLDRIGSFAVESLALNTEKYLRQKSREEGKSVSARFSPGYCDWAIEEQEVLAKVIDFSKAGISLTENFMMHPKKSISSILGVGNKYLFARDGSPCEMCGKKDCDWRRES